MKHVKTYKIFEKGGSRGVNEYESIRNYLGDIFLELEDIGFDIRIEGRFIRTNSYEDWTGLEVEIKRSEKFLLSDVKDYILTCETYLQERGFYICGFEVDTPSSFKGRTETYSLDYLIGLNKSNPEKYKLELVNFRFKIRRGVISAKYMKISENIAYAKSILNKNGISNDSEEYKDYLKIREICGQNNGYVGILTKLRFIDGVSDMDEIESIFNVLKSSKIDINKLNRLTYEDILEMFYEELTDKVDKSDIELYYKDDQYSYYRVYTYKGILKIGSPSWCLKTKSNWDQYQSIYPEQWVVVDNRHKGSLISPDNNYLENYSNAKKVWVRYGISLKKNEDNTISWTANDDNNGQVSVKPQSWTFFGVMNTVLNLTNGNKKSYYDSFIGCQKVNKTWHKIVDKKRFLERLRLNEDTFDENEEVYVTFSKSYSFIPIILVLNNWNFHFFFPTDKNYDEGNAFTKPGTLSGEDSKQIIFDYIRDKDDIYFDGIKLKYNMTTIEDIKNKTSKSGRKLFVDQFGKWLIFDRNENYYFIVNTDVDEIEVSSRTLRKFNYDMKNPIAWFLDKKTMNLWRPSSILGKIMDSDAPVRDYHKEVIKYIKDKFSITDPNYEKPKKEKKVKIFKNFFKFEGKREKVFENSGSGNASFDWLRKQNNERFFKLADILTSEVFDEFKVMEKTTERFSDEEPYPTHRFWAFNILRHTLDSLINFDFTAGLYRLRSSDEISETDKIEAIYVYNIPETERDNFWEEVLRTKERVFNYCGKHLVVSEESYVDAEIVYDFIITFGD